MASTNKTTNLELNQWVLSDPFLMEDMNEDNRKIDEAISGKAVVKLISVISTSDATQIDFDLSGVDLTQYSSLTIEGCFACTPASTVSFPYIRINNVGDAVYYHTADNFGAAGLRAYLFALNGSHDTDVPACFSAKLFGVSGATATAASSKNILGELISYGCLSGNDMIYMEQSALNMAQETAISSINILTNTSSGYFKAGSEFTIYGVRK